MSTASATTPAARLAPAVALALFAACLGGSASRAQGIDTKSNAPIDIAADEAEVINSRCLVIWRGSAEALQADSRLRANTISVFSKPKGKDSGGQAACGGTDHIVADGNVFYVTPQQHVRGDHAVYTAAADEIVITGDVIVVQGKDVARGDRLTLKVSTKEARMESLATGPGKTGRVRGVFYPDENTPTQAPAKP